MYKIYITFILLLYFIYTLFFEEKTFFEKKKENKKKIRSKENIVKYDFIDEMINKYGFFLNVEEKKYVKNNIYTKKKFFSLIDEIYLGKKIISKNENKISTHYLVGKAFMTTYLESTPNCLRIVNNSHERHEYGYIYTVPCTKNIENIDILKTICGGILYHNISSDKNLELSFEDLELLKKLKKEYSMDDIINEIYSTIYENKKRMLRLERILFQNKTILFEGVF